MVLRDPQDFFINARETHFPKGSNWTDLGRGFERIINKEGRHQNKSYLGSWTQRSIKLDGEL